MRTKQASLDIQFALWIFVVLISMSVPLHAREGVSGDTHVATYFRPELNGVQISDPVFRYDFSSLRQPKIGPYDFAFKEFKVEFSTLSVSYPGSSKYTYAHVMSFDWPKGFVKEGEITVETIKGQEFFRTQVNKESLSKWRQLREDLRMGKKPGAIDWNIDKVRVRSNPGFQKNKYGQLILKKWDYAGFRVPFRFCVSSKNGDATSKICSPYLETRRNGQTQLWQWKRKNPDGLTVFIDDDPAPVYGEVAAKAQEKILFQALFDNGMVLEFDAPTPRDVIIEEVVVDSKTGYLHVTGRGSKPADAFWGLKGAPPQSLWRLKYFDKTFGNARYYWELELPSGTASIVSATNGIDAFEYPMRYKRLPPKDARVYLKKQKEETYDRFPSLRGYFGQNVRLKVEAPAEVDFYPEEKEFEWEMYAPEKGAFNFGTLKVKHEGRDWVATHDIFRGHSGELSFRAQGVLSGSGSFAGVTEFAGSYWFEDLFGWQNDLLSVQRWGVSVTSLKSLAPFALKSGGQDFNMDLTNFTLKYRFNQGLWARNETIGLRFDYQQVAFDAVKANMSGIGAFWARPMPKIFDSAFNILPFLRYPKFVNMDFIWFLPSSVYDLDSRVNQVSSFAINFHGKILWTPSFFGELGFGARNYGFTEIASGTEIDSFLGYLNVGLGFNF